MQLCSLCKKLCKNYAIRYSKRVAKLFERFEVKVSVVEESLSG